MMADNTSSLQVSLRGHKKKRAKPTSESLQTTTQRYNPRTLPAKNQEKSQETTCNNNHKTGFLSRSKSSIVAAIKK
ncbi:MAG: hypothetical protein CSA20_03840 [Deltaproteobacteria bacterium]|nr:MAG: hypothetical protein CSA20_03840 [Deltaproteobacteria bacterium]